MYSEDPNGFKEEMTAVYKDLFTLLDTNTDCRQEVEETMIAFEFMGHSNKLAELEYFEHFDDNHLDTLVEAWVDFHTNTEKTKNDHITEPIKKTLKCAQGN